MLQYEVKRRRSLQIRKNFKIGKIFQDIIGFIKIFTKETELHDPKRMNYNVPTFTISFFKLHLVYICKLWSNSFDKLQ